jgi:hypothetical protein
MVEESGSEVHGQDVKVCVKEAIILNVKHIQLYVTHGAMVEGV